MRNAPVLDPAQTEIRQHMVERQLQRILNLCILEWDDNAILARVHAIVRDLRARDEWEVIE